MTIRGRPENIGYELKSPLSWSVQYLGEFNFNRSAAGQAVLGKADGDKRSALSSARSALVEILVRIDDNFIWPNTERMGPNEFWNRPSCTTPGLDLADHFPHTLSSGDNSEPPSRAP